MAGEKINLATSAVEDPLALIQATLEPKTITVADEKEEPVAKPAKKPAAKKPAKK
jgi:hypothetical protein